MRAKVKIMTKKDEVILIVREADTKAMLYDLSSKESRLKRIYSRGDFKTIVTGRQLTDKEKDRITKMIEEIANTEIEFREEYKKKSAEKKEEPEVKDLGLHAIKSTFEREIETSQTKFIHGNLRSGQREEFVGSLVIIGDLNYGAEVVAGENIIVTGTIRGLAHAGANGNKKAIIAGHAIDCTQVRIANIVKEVTNKEGKLPFIYLKDNDIIIELSQIKGMSENKPE